MPGSTGDSLEKPKAAKSEPLKRSRRLTRMQSSANVGGESGGAKTPGMSRSSAYRATQFRDEQRFVDEAREETKRLQQFTDTVEPADVRRSAARLLERWIEELRSDMPTSQDIARMLTEFIHRNKPFRNIGGPLIDRLVQVTPKDPFVRWEFLEELLEAFSLEDQFDQKSYIHAKTPPLGERLAHVIKGRPPAVFLGTPATSFSWDSYVPPSDKLPKVRLCALQPTNSLVRPNEKHSRMMMPGPGTYSEPALIAEGIKNPRQGVFPPVGGPRTQCAANIGISQRGRFS